MNQRTIHWNPSSGVWGFGAAWPNNGPWAVTLPGVGIQTHLSIVPRCPGGDGMYLDVRSDGAIAVQGHQGDRSWLLTAGWTDEGIAWGPHAQVFRADGTLAVIVSQAEYQATGGWRYGKPDGTLMPCVASYADPARGLYEWTEWADGIAIGQGGKPDEGAVVWADGVLRRLSFQALRPSGALRCIVSKRVGNDFAITVVDAQQALTTITYATLTELRALPPVMVTVPPIEPPPIEPPPVEPPIQPPPVEPPIEPPPVIPPIEPPKEQDVMAAYGTIIPGFKPGDCHDNGNGTVSVKKPNGKWLCVTPDGFIEERDGPGGVWESFVKTGTSLIAYRERLAPNDTAYVLPLVGA